MTQPQKTANSIWPNIRRLLKLSGKLTFWLYLALTFDLILAAIIVVNNALLRQVFDSALAGDQQRFWLYALLTFGLTLPNILLAYWRTASRGRFSEGTLAKLRQAIAKHTTGLPVSYLEQRHSGDLLSILNADLDKLKGLLGSHLPELFAQAAQWILAFAYILSINWALTLVSTVLTPIIFILINFLTQPIAKRSQEMQDEIG